MKKKKLNLAKLKVASFITSISEEEIDKKIIGGAETRFEITCAGDVDTRTVCTRDFHVCNALPSSPQICAPDTAHPCIY